MYNTYKYEYFRATHMLAFTNSGRTINKKHCVKHNWRNGCNMKMVQRPFPLTHKSVSFNVFYIIPIDFRPKSSNDNIIFDEQIDRRAMKLNHIIFLALMVTEGKNYKIPRKCAMNELHVFIYIILFPTRHPVVCYSGYHWQTTTNYISYFFPRNVLQERIFENQFSSQYEGYVGTDIFNNLTASRTYKMFIFEIYRNR